MVRKWSTVPISLSCTTPAHPNIPGDGSRVGFDINEMGDPVQENLPSSAAAAARRLVACRSTYSCSPPHKKNTLMSQHQHQLHRTVSDNRYFLRILNFSTHGQQSAAQGSSTTVSRSEVRLIQHLDSSVLVLVFVRRWFLIGYFLIHLLTPPLADARRRHLKWTPNAPPHLIPTGTGNTAHSFYYYARTTVRSPRKLDRCLTQGEHQINLTF
jgi:hypothetical protein